MESDDSMQPPKHKILHVLMNENIRKGEKEEESEALR